MIIRAVHGGRGFKKGDHECYDRGRFFTFTGHVIDGWPTTIEDRQAEHDVLHSKIWPKVNGEDHTNAFTGNVRATVLSRLLDGNTEGYTS